MTDRQRCSDSARLRDDPRIGTAPPAMRWMLVEQNGGWGRDALTSLDAPAVVRSHLERALAESGARLQLIRRPGRVGPEREGAPRRWFVVDVGAGGVVAQGIVGVGGTDGERAASVAAALQSPVDGLSAGRPRDDRRFVLVCTNGRHDVCCAVRGRPVAAALAALRPDDVWETTHTGGDRFASNLVMLPEGVVYGGLDPGSAVAALDEHDALGRVSAPTTNSAFPRHLRGFVGLLPAEQAARAALAPQLSEAGLAPWNRERLTAKHSRDGNEWTCTFRLDGKPWATVTGHDEIRPAQHLTCSATAVSRARVPVVDEITQDE